LIGSKFLPRTMLGLFVAVLCLCGNTARSQTVRPEAGPFDPSKMEMQSPPPQGVAIRAGRLFDSKSGKMLTNQVIVVKGDRIADVGPADKVQIPDGARVIDLSRATVLPGLIDRHVHLFQEQQPNDGRAAFIGLNYALKDMYAGFTTLQDMGSPFTYASVELRDAINKVLGFVDDPQLPEAIHKHVVRTREEIGAPFPLQLAVVIEDPHRGVGGGLRCDQNHDGSLAVGIVIYRIHRLETLPVCAGWRGAPLGDHPIRIRRHVGRKPSALTESPRNESDDS